MSFSQQIKTSKSDEYYTPKYAVDIIVPYLKAKGFTKIWCPFDKAHSEFVKILKREGFEVVFGHIETGQDFFEQNLPENADCVVSNPPFSKRDAIFKRLYELKIPFALVMNGNGIFDSRARFELFRNNDFELLIPRGRIKFFDESMVLKNSPNFQSIYVCHGMLDRQIVFTNMIID
ncbi:hypothetical protein [Streptococcus cuniculi]|uniref:Sugar-phospahte nucleotidyltransferase n=1 Tax=Streptococcus cuniculi TaxID=1432788 RepID=A0A4Y9JCI6_9STRE|nr:hypothetical protein [Streptococcus cuniculi]MBF0778156.1 hypothetical protein [Streptococcus cuniculi]TFU97898.1 hypothetical protein E4T82_05385 [Streptococcus cuniculi]